jgi:two-component system sensor histidine kinase DesK
MTIALVPPGTGRLSWGVRRSEAKPELGQRQDHGRLIQLATVGVMAFVVWIPLIHGFDLIVLTSEPAHSLPVTAATGCYLPVVFWLVRSEVRGTRPSAAVWVLAAMAAGVLATLPVIGIGWLPVLEPLAGLALILSRWPWSLLAYAASAVVPASLAVALGHPELAGPYAIRTVYTGTMLAALVWLIGAIGQLRDARLELAQTAVVRERLRIDGDLQQTLGTALEEITAAGERASGLAAADPAAAEADLRALAGASRTALTQSRRLVRRYQQVPLQAELETAAMLLTAAGIATRVAAPPGEMPDAISAELRSQLRSELGRVLRQNTQRQCVITVTCDHGQARVELEPDTRSDPPGMVKSM